MVETLEEVRKHVKQCVFRQPFLITTLRWYQIVPFILDLSLVLRVAQNMVELRRVLSSSATWRTYVFSDSRIRVYWLEI